MRLASLTFLLILLAGCQKDFDTEYAETEQKVKAAEAKLDAEMAKEAKESPARPLNPTNVYAFAAPPSHSG